ncbi:amino acid ABC transporter permease, partial [Streptomyces cinereoruber]
MIENEAQALFTVFAIFAFGFIVLTLPTGLVLGWAAKRLAVKR